MGRGLFHAGSCERATPCITSFRGTGLQTIEPQRPPSPPSHPGHRNRLAPFGRQRCPASTRRKITAEAWHVTAQSLHLLPQVGHSHCFTSTGPSASEILSLEGPGDNVAWTRYQSKVPASDPKAFYWSPYSPQRSARKRQVQELSEFKLHRPDSNIARTHLQTHFRSLAARALHFGSPLK